MSIMNTCANEQSVTCDSACRRRFHESRAWEAVIEDEVAKY